MSQRKFQKVLCKKGFTLVEGLVLLFIFAVALMAFYQVFTLGTQYILESKQRVAAVALANERMEQIRNIPYDDIAIVGGIPSGSIVQDEVVSSNNSSFRVIAQVRYVDDEQDGTAATTDTIPTDYKLVDVYVLWSDGVSAPSTSAALSDTFARDRVRITSQFVPPGGLETVSGGGTLSINVLDLAGAPIDDASVRIVNSAESIDTTNTTDATGNITFPGAPASVGGYEITVSKTNYETVFTEPPFDNSSQLYDPTYPHQSVVEGDLTVINFITDLTADVVVHTEDPFCSDVGSISFDIVGGRIKGTDPNNGGAPVYVLDTSLTTDSDGEVTVRTDTDGDGDIDSDDEASLGEYTVTLTDTDHTFWKVVPGSDTDRTIMRVEGDVTDECNFVLIKNNTHTSPDDGIFVQVQDSSTSAPLEDVDVRVFDALLAYDLTQKTDEYGYVYFPEELASPLVNGTEYTIVTDFAGYDDETDTVTVDGFEQVVISITPS